MEIKDFGELNALNKLFGKIKFNEDLDFDEFKEFVGSPLIANIFKRVHQEFWEESIKRGYIKSEQKASFNYDSYVGKTLRKRIDDLTIDGLKDLFDKNNLDQYLEILITPLDCTKEEFQLLKQYALEKIKSQDLTKYKNNAMASGLAQFLHRPLCLS